MILSLDILSSPQTGRTFVVGVSNAAASRWMLIGAGSRGVSQLLISRLEKLASSHGETVSVDLAVVTAPDESRSGGLVALADDECRRRRDAQWPPMVNVGVIWHNWPAELAAEAGNAFVRRAAAAIRETSAPPWIPDINLPGGQALIEAITRAGWETRPAYRGRESLPAAWEGTIAVLAPSAASTVADIDADRGASALVRLYELLSIAVLIETPAGRLLLCGGASTADILAGLDHLEVAPDDVLAVDAVEVPQSGNTRRFDAEFFRRIRADHYIFPSPPSSEDRFAAETMLASREDDDFTVWPADTGDYGDHVTEVLSERAALGNRSFRIHDPGGTLALHRKDH